MEVTQDSWDLDAGDAGSGWRWDTNLGTWIAIWWSWLEVRCYLDVGEMQISGPRLRWDSTETMKKHQSGSLDWEETQISRPVWDWDDAGVELRCNLVNLRWRWDVTWKLVRYKYQEQYWGKIQLRQRRNVNLSAWVERRHKTLDLDGVDMGPGLGWDAHLETRMGWYGTGMELRYNSPVEKWWRWDTHLETCMHLRWCLDGAKMQFGRPGWRLDVTWM